MHRQMSFAPAFAWMNLHPREQRPKGVCRLLARLGPAGQRLVQRLNLVAVELDGLRVQFHHRIGRGFRLFDAGHLRIGFGLLPLQLRQLAFQRRAGGPLRDGVHDVVDLTRQLGDSGGDSVALLHRLRPQASALLAVGADIQGQH
ncbi:hypothetical protein MCW82_07265 [Azospirillum doebereinerae]|uniref:hypothetical protein n=1 Tax=Azospirillum doebereinerae TaxID=92933 RepID=UPI001EE4EE42|nr:hypothetical protein [Azospirillum doebereinerae]MCG5239566.1 hypothetical protein [Azospirillum doebereinerae]